MEEETKNILVVKRTGEEVPYNRKKIVLAIEGANKDANYEMTDSDVMSVALQVNIKIQEKDRIQVEAIQNLVEDTLMLNNYTETARQYIRYRQRHEQKRAASQHLMESYNDLLFSDSEKMNLKRDNANINGDAPMGIMLKLGAEGSKTYADNYGIPEEYVKPDKEGLYHIHDKDFSFITFNCTVPETQLFIKTAANSNNIIDTNFHYFDSLFDDSKKEECIDISSLNYRIQSKNGEETKIAKVMRRYVDEDIYQIQLRDNTVLNVTKDHLLYVNGEDKPAKLLQIGDQLTHAAYNRVPNDNLQVDITDINKIHYTGYVYDFETESHYFCMEGIVSHNCCQLDLGKMLKNGFSTGHGFLREPNSIRSAAALACIAIQSNQNDMFKLNQSY